VQQDFVDEEVVVVEIDFERLEQDIAMEVDIADAVQEEVVENNALDVVVVNVTGDDVADDADEEENNAELNELMENIVVLEEILRAQIIGPEPNQHSVGTLTHNCAHCNARHFIKERTQTSTFSLCSGNGKVCLTGDRVLQPLPILLRQLLTENSPESRHFQRDIREYNNALAFASVVSRGVPAQPPGRGPRTFVVHGQLYGYISHADAGEDNLQFCQLYFIDTEKATECRLQTRNTYNPQLLENLDRMLRGVNAYAERFMHMKEKWERERVPPRAPRMVSMKFVKDNRDPGRRNNPTVQEIAAVFVGNDGDPPASVDFVVYDRNPRGVGNFQLMSTISRHADPMLYPLFFPHGEGGWAPQMPHEGQRQTAVHRNRHGKGLCMLPPGHPLQRPKSTRRTVQQYSSRLFLTTAVRV